MRLLAQAAEIPQLFDGPLQVPGWTIAAIGAPILLVMAAFFIYRRRHPLI